MNQKVVAHRLSVQTAFRGICPRIRREFERNLAEGYEVILLMRSQIATALTDLNFYSFFR